MIFSTVSSKRLQKAFGVVGKGLVVGLFAGASAIAQAGMLANQAAYVDGTCGSANNGARHAGSRSGCTVVLNEQFTESYGAAGSIQASFTQPAAVAGAAANTISRSALNGIASAKANQPGAIAPVVSAPVAVVPAAVPTQQIIAAAPPTVPASQPVVTPTAITGGGNNLPTPTVAVFAVPEPGTMALLFGGFLALIGIRYKRAAAAR